MRYATKEEWDALAPTSDLGPGCMVLAADTSNGTIFGVIRKPVELDPVHFPPDASPSQKVLFIRDAENFLMGQGETAFYFNVSAGDEMSEWRRNVEKWGAEPVSKSPEIRYRKLIGR